MMPEPPVPARIVETTTTTTARVHSTIGTGLTAAAWISATAQTSGSLPPLMPPPPPA